MKWELKSVMTPSKIQAESNLFTHSVFLLHAFRVDKVDNGDNKQDVKQMV